jgi:hypothetical protein
MPEPSERNAAGSSGPPVEVGGAPSAAWREEAITRALELEGLANWLELEPGTQDETGQRAAKLIADQLARARSSPARDPHRRIWRRAWDWVKGEGRGGATIERTLGSLDAVEADLLRLAPDDYVRGLMPSLQAHVNRFLPKDDPRRMRFAGLAEKAETEPLTRAERGAAIAAYHAANSQRRRELLRLRTFRNVLFGAAGLLLVVAVLLGILGSAKPDLIPLCFTPDDEKAVCPTEERALPAGGGTDQGNDTGADRARGQDVDDTIEKTVSGWDLWVVEILGLVAAGVASAFALRRMRGTSLPYSLSVALAALKLSTGALTAFLGLLLMRGGFVPGLSALDTSAQILSWAIVFGYAQQLFTRFVDKQASNVLERVGGRGAAGDRPMGNTAD